METALSVYLEQYATTLGSREQMAIAEFADALLIIPKTLAVNAAKVRAGGGDKGGIGVWRWRERAAAPALPCLALPCVPSCIPAHINPAPTHPPTPCQDATELVAKLRAYHYTAQTQEGKAALARMGLDLVGGTTRDSIAAGVVEPALSKTKIIQFATEAAITILRIDDLIRLEADPQEGEE